MRQWMLKITEYADKLLDDLGKLNWPEKIKLMQKKIGSKLGKKERQEKLEEMGEEVFKHMRDALDLMNPYKPQ